VRDLCEKAREVLVQESNVQPVPCPVRLANASPFCSLAHVQPQLK
jgi:hypothetical protein